MHLSKVAWGEKCGPLVFLAVLVTHPKVFLQGDTQFIASP